MSLLLQIIVALCFLALIVVLFVEKLDYLMFAFILVIIASLSTIFLLDTPLDPILNPRNIEFYINGIDWEVVAFLIAMFTIVQILNERKIFHETARRIVTTFKNNIRIMFYFICAISTLTATILEDLSVAIIFGPVIVLACLSLRINPTPFLLGMTICINIAATLTPFGSAQNILIFNSLDLTFGFFLKNFSVFFVVSSVLTLFLLDQFMLKKYLRTKWVPKLVKLGLNPSNPKIKESVEIERQEISSMVYDRITEFDDNLKKQIDSTTFYMNLGALIVFLILLLVIPSLYLAAFIALVIFVLINPIPGEQGSKGRISLSHYLRKVDFKLIFFFICLFLLVHLMEANGTIDLLEILLENISSSNVFVMSLVILLSSSLLSAFLDNAPVTIMFLPIMKIILAQPAYSGFSAPIIVAFVLGINLGGNILPQGSAADLMTLEIAREYNVEDLNYKKLFKIGGLFALIHILIGIIYIAVLVWIL